MIISALHRGKIYAGDTRLASTITVEQTAAMQLTVRAGTFTYTNGDAWTLATDAVFDISANANTPTECIVEIGDIAGVCDAWCGTRLLDDTEDFDVPAGWRTGHAIVFPFVIPAGATTLDEIAICVLTVEPGFPAGTVASDWVQQSGVISGD